MILKKLRKKLIYVAYKKTQNWQDAEDLAHDALLATFELHGTTEQSVQSNKFSKTLFSNLYKVYYKRLQNLTKLKNAIQCMQEGMLGEEIQEQLESGDFTDQQVGSRVRVTIR